MKWAVPKSNPDLLVSDAGLIVRMATCRLVKAHWQTFPEKELAQRSIGAGYRAVSRKLNGQPVTLYVHRLVAEAFHGLGWDGAEVNHIDGVKTNNMASNLEWVTHSQNHIHAVCVGLSVSAKITTETAKLIFQGISSGKSSSVIAQELQVSRQTVTHIKYGRTWQHLTNTNTVQSSRG